MSLDESEYFYDLICYKDGSDRNNQELIGGPLNAGWFQSESIEFCFAFCRFYSYHLFSDAVFTSCIATRVVYGVAYGVTYAVTSVTHRGVMLVMHRGVRDSPLGPQRHTEGLVVSSEWRRSSSLLEEASGHRITKNTEKHRRTKKKVLKKDKGDEES